MITHIRALFLTLATLVSVVPANAQNALPGSGPVGIGVTSPTHPLHVKSTEIVAARFQQSSSDQAAIQIDSATTNALWQAYIPNGATDLRFWNGSDVLSLQRNGNVGIGTNSPQSTLEIKAAIPLLNVNGSSTAGFRGTVYQLSGTPFAWDRAEASSGEQRREVGPSAGWGGFQTFYTDTLERMRISPSGNIGVGTSVPLNRLQVSTSTNSSSMTLGSASGVAFSVVKGDEGYGLYAGISGAGYSWLQGGRTSGATAYNIVLQASGGNVGIGTENPGTNRLAVNGTVRAKEVVVDTGWSDYVFAPDYALAPLSEIETHIKKHQHLPGIPSASEVAEHGISVGEMQAKLLAKIEELTLHAIAQEKRTAAVEIENTKLRCEIEALNP